jgi:hypothetical protein
MYFSVGGYGNFEEAKVLTITRGMQVNKLAGTNTASLACCGIGI